MNQRTECSTASFVERPCHEGHAPSERTSTCPDIATDAPDSRDAGYADPDYPFEHTCTRTPRPVCELGRHPSCNTIRPHRAAAQRQQCPCYDAVRRQECRHCPAADGRQYRPRFKDTQETRTRPARGDSPGQALEESNVRGDVLSVEHFVQWQALGHAPRRCAGNRLDDEDRLVEVRVARLFRQELQLGVVTCVGRDHLENDGVPFLARSGIAMRTFRQRHRGASWERDGFSDLSRSLVHTAHGAGGISTIPARLEQS